MALLLREGVVGDCYLATSTAKVTVLPDPEPTKLAAVVKLNDLYYTRVGSMWALPDGSRWFWHELEGCEIVFEGIDV